MEHLLQKFESHLKKEAKSNQTISSYVLSVKKYNEWYYAKFHEEFTKLHEENILSFKQHLVQEEKSAMTVNMYLHSLRAFNKFLVDKNQMQTLLVHSDFYQHIQSKLTSPVKFEPEEIERFYQVILDDVGRNHKYVYRDYAIAKVMGLAGLRISEVLALQVDDIKMEAKELLVRNAKGNKTRTVLLNQELSRLLHKYVNEIRPLFPNYEESNFMFMNRMGVKLSRKTIYSTFKVYSEKVGLTSNISPHTLRHHFCTQAVAAGLDIHEIAHLAGHNNIQTTLKYTNVSRKQLLTKLDDL